MRFDMWKSKAQKGAFLVFTALMIPIIFLCAGFAVDLGSKWAYTSKLQNAVDAAALAGANNFANGDTIQEHPNADGFAYKYLETNYGYLPTPPLVERPQAQEVEVINLDTKKKEKRKYYRVSVSEKVPALFMSMFGYKYLDVQVEAVALIGEKKQDSGGENPDNPGESITFRDMIFVKNSLTGTFNNDMYNNGWINTTFDGDIRIGSNDTYNGYINNSYYRFYDSRALGKNVRDLPNPRDYYKTVQRIERKDYFSYQKYLSDVETTIKNSFSKSNSNDSKTFTDQNINIPSQTITNNTATYYYFHPKQGEGAAITIDQSSLSQHGDTNSPIYCFIDSDSTHINININGNGNRPVIIFYFGRDPDGVSFGGNNGFRGALFMPNSKILGNIGGKFSGSIVASDLVLQANHAQFFYEKFGTPGGNNTPVTPVEDGNNKSQLVIDKTLKW